MIFLITKLVEMLPQKFFRRFHVKFGLAPSDDHPILAEVPHRGSILGTILFLPYTVDAFQSTSSSNEMTTLANNTAVLSTSKAYQETVNRQQLGVKPIEVNYVQISK